MSKDKIERLRGPERVRRRPAVIFSSDGIAGAQTAVGTLLALFATEAQLGYCKRLTVRQAGAELEISGDDRGLYLGQDSGDDSIWTNIFCELFAAPANARDESGWSLGLWDHSHHALFGEPEKTGPVYCPEEMHFFELCAIQYASKFMDVSVVRNGIKSVLRFRKGYNVGGIHNEPSQDENGTRFRLEMDCEVFSETVLPQEFFLETLRNFAMLTPGLCCKYVNTESALEQTFCYPNGTVDYTQMQMTDRELPVYTKRIEAKGKERYNRAEYEACVELTIGYTPAIGKTLCLHNFRNLICGGTHYERLREQVCHAFNMHFGAYITEVASGVSARPLTFDELSPHLTIVLATWCSAHCSVWDNGARLSIQNKMIADMTCDAAAGEFCNYVYKHGNKLRSLVDTILEGRRKRT